MCRDKWNLLTAKSDIEEPHLPLINDFTKEFYRTGFQEMCNWCKNEKLRPVRKLLLAVAGM